MNKKQMNEMFILLVSFALSYLLYQNSQSIPIPVLILCSLVVLVMLIKVERNSNVS